MHAKIVGSVLLASMAIGAAFGYWSDRGMTDFILEGQYWCWLDWEAREQQKALHGSDQELAIRVEQHYVAVLERILTDPRSEGFRLIDRSALCGDLGIATGRLAQLLARVGRGEESERQFAKALDWFRRSNRRIESIERLNELLAELDSRRPRS